MSKSKAGWRRSVVLGLTLGLLAVLTLAVIGIVSANTNTVTVPGAAGLPGNLIGSDGSAPVDSGLDLTNAS